MDNSTPKTYLILVRKITEDVYRIKINPEELKTLSGEQLTKYILDNHFFPAYDKENEDPSIIIKHNTTYKVIEEPA